MKKNSIIALVVIVLFGCAKDSTVSVISHPNDYSIDQVKYCDCLESGDTVRIFVAADTMADVISLSDSTHLPFTQWRKYRTLKGLFEEIARVDTSLFVIEITYDSKYGYPSMLKLQSKLSYRIREPWVVYSTWNYQKYK